MRLALLNRCGCCPASHSYMRHLLPPAGGLLDYGALRAAVECGRVAGLGLDVQEEEPVDPQHWLAQHPAVYLTPHVAGVTELSCELAAGGACCHSAAQVAAGPLPLQLFLVSLCESGCRAPPFALSDMRADRNMARVVADAVVRVRQGRPPQRLLNEPSQPRALDWLT